jgi:hypothetical protein
MICPSCAARSKDDAAECPACGLVFAKWRERREKEKREGLEALKAMESRPSPPRSNPWLVRGAAAVVVAAWVLGLSLYYVRFRLARPRAGAQQSLRGNKIGPF